MNNEYYCGLGNHGNTCFFNSAIQSIMRCSVFITFISNLRIDSELIIWPGAGATTRQNEHRHTMVCSMSESAQPHLHLAPADARLNSSSCSCARSSPSSSSLPAPVCSPSTA